MSWKAMDWVMKHHPRSSATAFRVSLALAWRLNKDTDRCDPSAKTIAKDARMSERNAHNGIAELRRLGVWEVIERSGRSSLYRLPPMSKSAGVGVQKTTQTHAENDTEPMSKTAPKPLLNRTEPLYSQGPPFDGNLYHYHEALVGYPPTPLQEQTLDNYMKLTGYDRKAVAEAMAATPNPRSRDWLRRVGDLLKARAKPLEGDAA